MDMGVDVEIVTRDRDDADASPSPDAVSRPPGEPASAAAPNDAARAPSSAVKREPADDLADPSGPSVVNAEGEGQGEGDDGDDADRAPRPLKRRKLDTGMPRSSSSRAVSPPWKAFVADGPTTIITGDGIRKSTRVNKETPTPAPAPPPVPAPKRTTTRAITKPPHANGTANARRQSGARPAPTTAPAAKAKTATPAVKKGPAASLHSPPTRKSDRHRKTAAAPGSPSGSPTMPRFVLKLKKSEHPPELPNRHPQHAPAMPSYPTFSDWLRRDDPLEGEEGQRITQERADEEAERRLRIVDAAERGVLSETRCSIYIPEPAEEPPPRYRHWDHVVAHALYFGKLLKEEKTQHRRVAKTLAREALEYWREKYKRKTQEEIEQEEADRAVLRYKQLVKDVKDSWSNVRVEIDKERVAKWEEEQLQLGHKAMDDMFIQAQEILGRGVVDSASSFVSEERDSEDEEEASGSDASNTSNEEEHDDIMSLSADSDDGNADDEDEDAHLTAQQLQAKYSKLPDLAQESSDDEENSEAECQKDETDDHTPEPTPDPDLEMEDAGHLLDDSTTTKGLHAEDSPDHFDEVDTIDPATVELEEVDVALLDSEDEGVEQESGSEEWPSDEGSDEEEQSESGSEDGDVGGLGVMGFLAPDEIKKIKEAAKVAVEDDDTVETPPSTGLDTHASAEGEPMKPNKANSESEADLERKIANDTGDSAMANAIPLIKEPGDETSKEAIADKSISQSRSRHSSSPPRTEIPCLLRGTLREYQHDGLDWLANLYDSGTNGILADEMGLGKTIQTIALLAYVAVNRGKWGPHLVVVPTSVMLNWEMEFKKWCPGFKILTYYGDIAERKRLRVGWRNLGRDMYNVVITSYQLILQDAAAFKIRPWQYLILDEAHNIKNFKSQRWQTMLNLNTERRLLLTGTPLQNNLDELWSLLYFLMPAGLSGEGRIAGLEEFTMALKNPTSQILDQGRQQLDSEAQKIVKKLHEVLRPYLLRRLKCDVEKQMPGKYEHVVYCKLSKRQRQLYDGFMGRASTKEILSSGNYMSIINCLMSLRKVCNHPDLFETRAIVTSLAMPRSVPAQYEIKDFLIRKRLHEKQEGEINLDALNLLFTRREQSSLLNARRSQQIRATRPLEYLIECQTRRLNSATTPTTSTVHTALSSFEHRANVAVRNHLETCLRLTRSRTEFMPIYGKGLIDKLTIDYQEHTFGARYQPGTEHVAEDVPRSGKGPYGFRAPRSPGLTREWNYNQITVFHSLIPTLEQRAEALEPLIARFSCATPAVAAEEIAPLTVSKLGMNLIRSSPMALERDPFHESRIRQSIAFPDKRLLQYDCGKLQRLAVLLRTLQAGGHRALIFTQMTKVLDILEQFLNIHGYRYLRLDGATKVEQRQILTDRFNSDPRILCFILSSRSGGLGINLTGADSVIFYDLDWNPAMDKQCQDRSHRIGQTRDVHIYKFVSEYTIEANILRKSNQKRLLDDVIIQKGDFTTDYFNKVSWRDALDQKDPIDEASAAMDRVLGEKAGLLGDAKVMRTVEDTEDQDAANVAQKEIVDEIHDDQVDFNESSSGTPANPATRHASEIAAEKQRVLDDAEKRHVDEYMLDLYREEYGKEPYKPPTDRQRRRNRKGHDVHRTHKKRKY